MLTEIIVAIVVQTFGFATAIAGYMHRQRQRQLAFQQQRIAEEELREQAREERMQSELANQRQQLEAFMRDALQQRDKEIDRLRDIIDRRGRELQNLQLANQRLASQFASADQLAADRHDQIKRLEKQHDADRTVIEDLRNRMLEYEIDKQRRETERQTLLNELTHLKHERESMARELAELKTQVESLRNRLSELDEYHQATIQRLEIQHKQEVDALHQQLRDKDSQIERLNTQLNTA